MRRAALALPLLLGPAGLAGPPQETPPPSPAPGRAAAEPPAARSRFDELLERELERLRLRAVEDFLATDRDGGGWVSFAEAGEALHLTRQEFLRYDTNRDGRLDKDEFVARQEALLERLGSFFSPSLARTRASTPGGLAAIDYPEPVEPEADRPGPADLLRLFDHDASGGLDRREVERLLVHLGVDLSADVIVAQMDADGTRALEVPELGPLTRLVALRLPGALVPGISQPWLAHELYGKALPRGGPQDEWLEPPRIPGPVPVFRRLDLDDDGLIEPEDLATLGSPVRLPVRPAAVVAALDLDGDGRLSPRELLSSLGDR